MSFTSSVPLVWRAPRKRLHYFEVRSIAFGILNEMERRRDEAAAAEAARGIDWGD